MSESKELAHAGQGGGAIARQSESGSIIAAILEAARDPAIDAGKVETMANLAMKMQDRELEAQFNRDLNAALGEMPTITKAGIIIIPGKDGAPGRTQGRFARFEDIDRVVRPILQRHNLAIRFEVGEKDQQITVRPILSHANGHTERGEGMRLPLDTSGAKNNVQGAGSAVSYGKRYTMCALLNIITEGTDDDGSLGKLAIDMPHERELLVLAGADDAFAADAYDAWFARQSVKDRGWLVTSGHHARFGGAAVALPGAAQQRPPASGGSDQQQHQADAPKRTALQWTENYERLCREARSLDDLREVQSEASDDIERLKSAKPALHKRAVEAGSAAFARLSGGEG